MATKKRKAGVADKDTVLAVLDDMVASFLIHDRENDDDLPRGEIERLVECEDLTIDEMVDRFREALEEHLEDLTTAETPDEDEEETDLDDDFEDEDD
jgi:lipoate-protein ligase A